MIFSPLIDDLIMAFRCLPGVGPKTAQRMVFYLLQRDRDGGNNLSLALKNALVLVKKCQSCRTLSEVSICMICSNTGRDKQLLCVVENPTDILAIEQTKEYNGFYFVLLGRLSPLDGISPEDLGVEEYLALLKKGHIKEIIMATNLTVEGETTAFYFAELAKEYGIKTSRIAQGVPFGGELENIDMGTLARALEDRDLIY
jgi:recombination protein RecR